MKAYVIAIKGNELSEDSARRTIDSARKHGVDAQIYYGVHKSNSLHIMNTLGLDIDNKGGIWTTHSYLDAAIGCFLSHYLLWKKSIEDNERLLILEHDVEFTDDFIDWCYRLDSRYNEKVVVNIGEPLWGSKWKDWGDGEDGIHLRTCRVTMNTDDCDCEEHYLAGAHSYIVTPEASKLLINAAHKKGIKPTDLFINKTNIRIADSKPYVCKQITKFSTIQRASNKILGDVIVGQEAWGDAVTQNNCMVFLADESMFEKIPPLMMNAVNDGHWTGEFVVVCPEDSDTSYLDTRNIATYHPPPLSDTPIHFNKMFMFNKYFEQWDWLLYVDLDVWFTNRIDLRLDRKNKETLYANEDGLTFMGQFYGADDDAMIKGKYKRELTPAQVDIRIKINDDYTRDGLYPDKTFQTCFMLWNSSINRGAFKKLTNAYFEYYVYWEMARAKHWEQMIFSLTFFDNWKPLGKQWVQCDAMNVFDWNIEDMQKGYNDVENYQGKGIIGIHFTQFFPPWANFNKRFYKLWKKYHYAI